MEIESHVLEVGNGGEFEKIDYIMILYDYIIYIYIILLYHITNMYIVILIILHYQPIADHC